MALKYTMQEAVSAWRRSASVAYYLAGRVDVQEDYLSVSAVLEQKNLAKEESLKYRHHYLLRKEDLAVVCTVPSFDPSKELRRAQRGDLTVILRDGGEGADGKPKQVLEVWRGGKLSDSRDALQSDKHGKIYADSTLGCMEVSPDGRLLVYIAEKKEAKKQSFLKLGLVPDSEGVKWGAEFDYVEDWGEQLVGKSQPVICVYDLEWQPGASADSPIKIIDCPETCSPGQVTWCSNNQLAGVAWSHGPRRLGLIYCTNRPSRLFQVHISSGTFEWFGLENQSAASPRCHLDTGRIAYLTCRSYGPHHKQQQVNVLDAKGIRIVETELSPQFYGMYGQEFPDRCWSSDGKKILFTTPCRSSLQSYVLDLDSGEIARLPLPAGCTGGIVLDVWDDVILLCGVSVTDPDRLFIGRAADLSHRLPAPGTISWIRLSGSDPAPNPALEAELLTLTAPDGSGAEYEATLVMPCDPERTASGPLVVVPHGGPHSCSVDQFSRGYHFFAQLGFSILSVNYRGSTGFGEESLNSLPGKVGRQDVDEVHHAVQQALAGRKDVLDPNLVFLFGGSHGGFLVTHLSGQFPDFYRAVSARNPVIDMATMLPTSDIADWTVVESGAGSGAELEKLMDPATMERMWSMSPIRYVAHVKAPTLLLIGKTDLRVPTANGVEYYRALKVHDKAPVRMVLYDDNHPLSKVPVDVDALVNTALWFQTHATVA